jgi:hypothetical protein
MIWNILTLQIIKLDLNIKIERQEYSKKEIADFNKVMSHARQIIDILTHED